LDPLKNYLRTSRALSINGKRNEVSKSDLLQIAELFTIKQAQKIITEISNAKNLFGKYASVLEIPENVIRNIEKEFCSFE
jgi:serine/threonine-protein kinase HipA